MNEQNWYIYQAGQQFGPFSKSQVVQLHGISMVDESAYLYKAGWNDWVPIKDTYAELGLAKPSDDTNPDERRSSSQRADLTGRVIIHNNATSFKLVLPETIVIPFGTLVFGDFVSLSNLLAGKFTSGHLTRFARFLFGSIRVS